MTDPAYRRVVIKLSGEYLAGQQGSAIDQPTVDRCGRPISPPANSAPRLRW